MILTLSLFLASLTTFAQVIINEIDVDQSQSDTMEFIELKTPTSNTSLDGYIVVLFNGSSDTSYRVFDLNGFTTDENGFLIIGTDSFPDTDIFTGESNTIQNGADAIAIYNAPISDFPIGSFPTTNNLVDAIVYGTNDSEDTELLNALNLDVQYNESINGNSALESIQRTENNTFCISFPTPRAINNCPSCSLVFSNITITCDDESSSIDTTTISIDYTGGSMEEITLTTTEGSISGDNPSNQATGTITVTEVNENTTLTISAIGFTCNLTETITTVVCETIQEVNDIATLRNGTLGAEYILSSEAILSFQQSFRNQKFIEDDTAGILIDDASGIITTEYEIGDGISGIQGTLNEFQGMMEFRPIEDPGPSSSNNNTIAPQIITLSGLTDNPEAYESELVSLQNITINTSQNTDWVVSTEYEMTSTEGEFVFRTSFFEVDYINTPVPTEAINIVGIITERNNGDYFFTARDTEDLSVLSLDNNNQIQASIYPNPTTDYLNIKVNIDSDAMVLAIIEATGKIISRTEINPYQKNQINVSRLNQGLYFIVVYDQEVKKTLLGSKFIKK